MHAYKIILPLLAGALMATACGYTPEGVAPKEEVDALRQEISELRESRDALQRQYIKQNEDLSAILNEITAVSGKAADLRLDLEKGSAQLTQAETISNSIKQIKARLNALEKTNAQLVKEGGEYARVIGELNKMIEVQQIQIEEYKAEIIAKDRTIRDQKDTITVQQSTIRRHELDLQRRVEEQAEMLCRAGITLEEIADNAPQVSWRKNKEKVSQMAQEMYRTALSYYEQSLESGYEPARERISSVLEKIN